MSTSSVCTFTDTNLFFYNVWPQTWTILLDWIKANILFQMFAVVFTLWQILWRVSSRCSRCSASFSSFCCRASVLEMTPEQRHWEFNTPHVVQEASVSLPLFSVPNSSEEPSDPDGPGCVASMRTFPQTGIYRTPIGPERSTNTKPSPDVAAELQRCSSWKHRSIAERSSPGDMLHPSHDTQRPSPRPLLPVSEPVILVYGGGWLPEPLWWIKPVKWWPYICFIIDIYCKAL